jgi:hypothetical protein
MSEARALLEGIVSQWDAGKASDDILTPDLIHEARIAVQRADRPEARVAVEGLTVEMLGEAIARVEGLSIGLVGPAPMWVEGELGERILANLPAPRPPEPDRTALVCSGCRQDVDPTKGMLVHCDACTAAALQRTLDAKAEPPAPRPPEPDRTAALVGPVTVAVVDALMAEEIGAGHYRWQVMNIVRPAIVAALAPTPDEAP